MSIRFGIKLIVVNTQIVFLSNKINKKIKEISFVIFHFLATRINLNESCKSYFKNSCDSNMKCLPRSLNTEPICRCYFNESWNGENCGKYFFILSR